MADRNLPVNAGVLKIALVIGCGIAVSVALLGVVELVAGAPWWAEGLLLFAFMASMGLLLVVLCVIGLVHLAIAQSAQDILAEMKKAGNVRTSSATGSEAPLDR